MKIFRQHGPLSGLQAQRLMLKSIPLAAIAIMACLLVAILGTTKFVEYRARDAKFLRDQAIQAARVLEHVDVLSDTSPLNQVNELVWALEDLQNTLPHDSKATSAIVLAYRQALNLRDSLRFIRPSSPEITVSHIHSLLTEARHALRREMEASAAAHFRILEQNLLFWNFGIAAALILVSILGGWLLYRYGYRPMSSLRTILSVCARKDSTPTALADADLYLLEPSMRTNIQTIYRLLREGDQLAAQMAQRVQGFQASQQMLELAKAIPGVVFQYEYLADGTRIHHFVSPKAWSFFGQSEPEGAADAAQYGHDWEDASPIPLALTHSLFEHVAQQQSPAPQVLEYDTEIAYVGQQRWIRTLATATPQTSGSTIVNGVWLDVSESIEQAQALTKAHSDAERVAEEKARLLAVMSHEIRTPLNGILGMAQLALKSDMPVMQRERIRKILSSGHHLIEIVNDVLDFSKIESGQLALEQTSFSLSQLVAEVCDLLAPRAAEKGLELWVDIPPPLYGNWLGDPFRLRQILVNFTVNAIKFTQAGEVSIHAKILDHSSPGPDAKNLEQESTLLLIEVHDTGIGISSQDQKNLFQAFRQADASITRRYGGTGLGLAISNHFAQLLGGQTGVRSRPGEGSVFWFTARIQRASPDVTHDELRGWQVLIAESHDGARAALRKTLANAFACKVVEANSGHQALQLLQTSRERFDLCIFASQLADMNAIQLLQATRQANYPGPIWFAGNQDSPELATLGKEPGVSILTKPLGLDILALAAKQALSHTSSHFEYASSAPLRFLIVDDNALNRAIAADFLQSNPDLHSSIDFAENGQQAIEKILAAQELPYDAVLMDVEMPVLDGLSATREIHELLQDPPPIFAMSAHHGGEQEAQALASGMLDFIHKPLVETQFWKVLSAWHITPLRAAAPVSQPADLPAQSDTFDHHAWLDLVHSLSFERAQELAEQFLTQSEQQLQELTSAYNSQDFSKLSAVLHQISGTAGSFGLIAAGSAAKAMSAAIRSQQQSQLPTLLIQLQTALHHGQAHLKGLIAQSTAMEKQPDENS